MSAPFAFVLSERTMCWRTQTPGVETAVDSTIAAWCYSPKRRSIVWGQSEGAGDPSDICANAPDDDLTDPIPGASLQTYPYVPDDDATGLKRFHEIVWTFSVIDDSGAPNFDFKFGPSETDTCSASARAMPNNPATPSLDLPAFYQAKTMVPRSVHVAPNLVVSMSDASAGAWRLHAAEVAWQPESVRAYNR